LQKFFSRIKCWCSIGKDLERMKQYADAFAAAEKYYYLILGNS
jgi:hypothetical protein